MTGVIEDVASPMCDRVPVEPRAAACAAGAPLARDVCGLLVGKRSLNGRNGTGE